jgi:ABC transport system ATP-binding/permease protein
MILVDAAGLGATRPKRPLFLNLSLTLESGQRLGVVGINGSGKSTLLRILAGEAEPEVGSVRVGRGALVLHLPQEPHVPAGPIETVVGGGWRGRSVIDRLGMAPIAQHDTSTLSGGQRKRVALAKILVTLGESESSGAGDRDLLILDEPTNHLDLEAIEFLENELANTKAGLVLVTHDRHVLDRVTNRVLELDRGHGYLHVPSGENAGSGYATFLAARAEREERAAANEQTRRNLAKRELAWLRRGAPARTSKPKARIESATALVNARADKAARTDDLSLDLGTARLGSKAVELHGVSYAWPGGETLIRDLDLIIEPGSRLGIVGLNGTGKTTLLDLVADRIQPTVGRIERGTTIRIGYYEQLGQSLDPSIKVRDAVAGPHRPPAPEDTRLMERFWFDADAQWAEIGTLSGGERRRLQLLLVLAAQPNVLLLDEPTNDLDLDTLRALEDFLDDWPGSLIAVSHDRAFLDRATEQIIAFDGAGRVDMIRGGVGGWLASRRVTASPASSNAPSRVGGPKQAAAKSVAAEPRKTGTTSPSTFRRLIAAAEKDLGLATARRDAAEAALAGAAPSDISRLSTELAAAAAAADIAEERWLEVAADAEASGLSVD